MATLTNRCPECGGHTITKSKPVGCLFLIFVFISMGLGLLGLLFMKPTYHCWSCGAKWK